MTVWADILFLVTPLAVLTATAAGVALGIVWCNVRPSVTGALFLWAGSTIGALWYAPLTVQRLAEPGLWVNGLRTIGSAALFEWFIVVAALVIAWRHRTR